MTTRTPQSARRTKKAARPSAPEGIPAPPGQRADEGRAVVAGTPPPAVQRVQALILAALEDMKALEITVLDVRAQASFTDLMIIASGTSTRHVKAIAERVTEDLKRAGVRPLGVEGESAAEWVLADFGDVVLHVMLPRAREFYRLEHLWGGAGADGGNGSG